MTHLLRSLIRQVLLESDGTYKPEAPVDAPLGKYAFANNREYSPKPPPETDTQIERALFKYLINHFAAGQTLSKFSADQILGFIEKDLYSDVFKAPSSGILYRGLNINNSNIAEKFLPKGNTLDDAIDQAIESGADFASFETQLDLTNKDERYAASWTKSLEKAKEFANNDAFEIILCASVEGNSGKWIDCEGLYRLRDISAFKHESEVIAAGTIRVNKVMIKPPRSNYDLRALERLKNLPKDQRIVKGDLNLEGVPIAELPDGLTVNGSLDLRDSDIASLPAGLKVGGTLDLRDTRITSLPAGLEVGGTLDLSDTGITSLPTGLKVVGHLDLYSTGIKFLPSDIQVGGAIYGLDREYWPDVPQRLKGKLR